MRSFLLHIPSNSMDSVTQQYLQSGCVLKATTEKQQALLVGQFLGQLHNGWLQSQCALDGAGQQQQTGGRDIRASKMSEASIVCICVSCCEMAFHLSRSYKKVVPGELITQATFWNANTWHDLHYLYLTSLQVTHLHMHCTG